MPQDTTCLKFPGRTYVQKTDPSLTQKDWDPNSTSIPQWTATAPYCVPGKPCNPQGCGCPVNLFNSYGIDTGNAQLVGCGNCQGGDSSWNCCGCCVQAWEPNNKSKCCDPVPNDEQKSSLYCDPAWCPFSPACIEEPVTVNYCQANLTDPQCQEACKAFSSESLISQAPTWCNGFVKQYCQLRKTQSTNSGNEMSPTDKTVCACSLHNTSSDECLWPDCVKSSDGYTWKTVDQYKHIKDTTYCSTQCKNIKASVAAGSTTSGVNAATYAQVCSSEPLPPVDTGNGTTNTELSDFLKKVPIYAWVILFLLILLPALYWLFKPDDPSPSPSSPSSPSSSPSPSSPST